MTTIASPTTITLTVEECLCAERALARIGAQLWPAKTAYHLAKLLRLVRAQVKAYEEARHALIRELGTVRAATVEERAHGADAEVWEVVPAATLATYHVRLRALREGLVAIDAAPLALAALGDQPVAAVDLADLDRLLVDTV